MHRTRALSRAPKTTTPTRPMPPVPANRLVWVLRTQEALGYPLSWQGQQLNLTRSDLATFLLWGDVLTVSPQLMAAAQAMADRHCTVADPDRDGLDPNAVAIARADARQAGFHPPACYDEAGVLLERAVAGTDLARADERAYELLTLIAGLAAGTAQPVVRASVGCSERLLVETARATGLQMLDPGFPAAAKRALDVVDQVEAGHIDPVHAVLLLRAVSKRKHWRAIPKQHPGLLAYIAEAAEQDATVLVAGPHASAA